MLDIRERTEDYREAVNSAKEWERERAQESVVVMTETDFFWTTWGDFLTDDSLDHWQLCFHTGLSKRTNRLMLKQLLERVRGREL